MFPVCRRPWLGCVQARWCCCLGWAFCCAAHALTPRAYAQLVWCVFLPAGVFVESVAAACGCRIWGCAVCPRVSTSRCTLKVPTRSHAPNTGSMCPAAQRCFGLGAGRFIHNYCLVNKKLSPCVACACFRGYALLVCCRMRCCWVGCCLRLCWAVNNSRCILVPL